MIEISGYTKNEKFAIAKDHLIPEILQRARPRCGKLRIDDEALKVIIEKCTREAGVRWLKKQLAKIARHVSEKIVSGNAELPSWYHRIILRRDPGKRADPPGSRAERTCPRYRHRACMDSGRRGHPLYRRDVHAQDRETTLTGQLGDVMKESATISSAHPSGLQTRRAGLTS